MTEQPHILVVDDDTRLRDLLHQYLTENDFRVTTAEDAADARGRLRGLEFDLIVLDVMMPGTDGFELCRTIKRERRYADIPIILLSARNREMDRKRGLSVGAADFLSKPYSPSELLARVREILSERPIEEETTR